MNIVKIREVADSSTAKLSDITRQLDFVGIAVLWIFLIGSDTGGLVYSGSIVYPLACFVLSLMLDMFQYIYQSIRWKQLGDTLDGAGLSEKDVEPSINTPAYWLFWAKVALAIFGYFFIAINIGIEILS